MTDGNVNEAATSRTAQAQPGSGAASGYTPVVFRYEIRGYAGFDRKRMARILREHANNIEFGSQQGSFAGTAISGEWQEYNVALSHADEP